MMCENAQCMLVFDKMCENAQFTLVFVDFACSAIAQLQGIHLTDEMPRLALPRATGAIMAFT